MIFTDAVQSSTQEYSKVNTFKEVSEITILAEPIDVIARIGTYINFCVKVEANNPTFQWYDKYGSQMPRMCKSNLTIGPVKEEDFGFYRLHIIDQKTGQTVLTRWTELKKAQPRVTQSDRNEYQQVEPSLIRTEPLPQSSPVQEKRKIYTECQHKPRQQCSNISGIIIIAEPIDSISRIGSYVNFSAKVEATNPTYQWYDKDGNSISGKCRNNLTIGPVKEEDFGFYQLGVRDGRTNQIELTRWTELKKAQPRLTQSDKNEYQQVEPSLIRTEPLPQSSPVQEKRKIYTEYLSQHQLEQLTPKLLMQPEGGAYTRGSRITLTAHFENATHYQWYKDEVKLEGCVGNTLVITNAYLGNTGEYTIYAMNSNNFHSVKTEVTIY